MGKLKRMDQVKNILEAYQDTGSIKGAARRLKVSKNTVREYVRRVLRHYEDISQALVLPEDELLAICGYSGSYYASDFGSNRATG